MLLFADGFALFTTNRFALQSQIDCIFEDSTRWRLNDEKLRALVIFFIYE